MNDQDNQRDNGTWYTSAPLYRDKCRNLLKGKAIKAKHAITKISINTTGTRVLLLTFEGHPSASVPPINIKVLQLITGQ